MKASDIRNWLGIYFLLTTTLLGTYIILFGETKLLPISKKDSMDAFQIIIPVFVAQLTTVFTWFSAPSSSTKDEVVSIPPWVVKAPPIIVIMIIVLSIISMVISANDETGSNWIDASTFKTIVTFCVTILNATSVLVVIRFFARDRNQGKS